MVSKIAAAESSTATGALGPPMSVLTQPGCIAANKIPVFIMSKSLAKAKKDVELKAVWKFSENSPDLVARPVPYFAKKDKFR